ncbi:hypothetical protein U9M48_030853 [Paspalum notatum var. saurae]|uniref:Uncharacterized protein n=1 Tax=Paspalum notatum var. saurae TaxID=547442 RepID=A0AAQ3X2Q4_PASNO
MVERSATPRCKPLAQMPSHSFSSGTYSTLPWKGSVHSPTWVQVPAPSTEKQTWEAPPPPPTTAYDLIRGRALWQTKFLGSNTNGGGGRIRRFQVQVALQ